MKWYYRLLASILLFSLAAIVLELSLLTSTLHLGFVLGLLIVGSLVLFGIVLLLYLSPKDLEERAKKMQGEHPSDSNDSQNRSVELKESQNNTFMNIHGGLYNGSYGAPERFHDGENKRRLGP
jgi:hypothetical protein